MTEDNVPAGSVFFIQSEITHPILSPGRRNPDEPKRHPAAAIRTTVATRRWWGRQEDSRTDMAVLCLSSIVFHYETSAYTLLFQ